MILPKESLNVKLNDGDPRNPARPHITSHSFRSLLIGSTRHHGFDMVAKQEQFIAIEAALSDKERKRYSHLDGAAPLDTSKATVVPVPKKKGIGGMFRRSVKTPPAPKVASPKKSTTTAASSPSKRVATATPEAAQKATEFLAQLQQEQRDAAPSSTKDKSTRPPVEEVEGESGSDDDSSYTTDDDDDVDATAAQLAKVPSSYQLKKAPIGGPDKEEDLVPEDDYVGIVEGIGREIWEGLKKDAKKMGLVE
jgi:hypothetical protein